MPVQSYLARLLVALKHAYVRNMCGGEIQVELWFSDCVIASTEAQHGISHVAFDSQNDSLLSIGEFGQCFAYVAALCKQIDGVLSLDA